MPRKLSPVTPKITIFREFLNKFKTSYWIISMLLVNNNNSTEVVKSSYRYLITFNIILATALHSSHYHLHFLIVVKYTYNLPF